MSENGGIKSKMMFGYDQEVMNLVAVESPNLVSELTSMMVFDFVSEILNILGNSSECFVFKDCGIHFLSYRSRRIDLTHFVKRDWIPVYVEKICINLLWPSLVELIRSNPNNRQFRIFIVVTSPWLRCLTRNISNCGLNSLTAILGVDNISFVVFPVCQDTKLFPSESIYEYNFVCTKSSGYCYPVDPYSVNEALKLVRAVVNNKLCARESIDSYVSPCTQSLPLAIDLIQPSPLVLAALLQSNNMAISLRWIRGLITFRQRHLNVRDCIFFDKGLLGISLSGPPWIVSGTEPPSSSLKIELGSPLLGINDSQVFQDHSSQEVRRLVSDDHRPCVLTCGSIGSAEAYQNDKCVSAADWVLFYATEIALEYLLHASRTVVSVLPPNIETRCHSSNRGEYPELIALFTNDFSTFIKFAVTCKMFYHGLIADRKVRGSKSRKLIKRLLLQGSFSGYTHRRESIQNWLSHDPHSNDDVSWYSTVILGFDPSVFIQSPSREFSSIVCASLEGVEEASCFLKYVSPACFGVAQSCARKLRSEGVVLEVFFLVLLLRVAYRCVCDSEAWNIMYDMSLIKGPRSLFWLRIFLAMILRHKDYFEKANVEDSTKILMDPYSYEYDCLITAESIRIDHEWMCKWNCVLDTNSSK